MMVKEIITEENSNQKTHGLRCTTEVKGQAGKLCAFKYFPCNLGHIALTSGALNFRSHRCDIIVGLIKGQM